MKVDVVVLPGFDGSDKLLQAFVELAPAWAVPRVVRLPEAPVASYQELAELLLPDLLQFARLVVVAESFSGPLAILLAPRLAPRVDLIVLCNSFVSRPSILPRVLPWGLIGHIMPPVAAMRYFMAGGNHALAASLSREMRRVSPAVRASRYRLLSTLDVRDEFQSAPCDVVVIKGSEDRLIGDGAAKQMRELRPDIAVEKLPSPHLTLQTSPEESWAAISGNFERAA